MHNSNPHKIYGEPVGDIKLLNHHKQAILDFNSGEDDDEKAKFILEFSNWEQSASTAEAAAVTQLKAKARSKWSHVLPATILVESDHMDILECQTNVVTHKLADSSILSFC